MSYSKRVQRRNNTKDGLTAYVMAFDELITSNPSIDPSRKNELLVMGRQNNKINNIQAQLYKELCLMITKE